MKYHSFHFAKKTVATALSAVLAAGAIAMTSPAQAVMVVNADLRPDFTIIIDNSTRIFYNVSGQQVYPIVYNGTTYLPVRAIGEIMGKTVDWNQTTKTITLSGVRTAAATTGTLGTLTQAQAVDATVQDDFTVVLDGKVCSFTDANGNKVYPVLYNGSTYLPIRAIGGLMGKAVNWDAQTKTVILSANTVTDADSFSNSTVTDADTITTTPTVPTPVTPDANSSATRGNNKTNSTAPTTSNTAVTREKALQTAMTHAGVTQAQISYSNVKLDWEKNRQVYEVEFYTTDGIEFDYEIDAQNGSVVSFKKDTKYNKGSYTPQNNQTTQNAAAYIGEAKAKSIALSQVSGAAKGAYGVRIKLDRDDGRMVYDVEFIYNNYEYEFEIDAYSGAILKHDMDSVWD